MAERQITISEQIEPFIPEGCAGCDNAQDKCAKLAFAVLQKSTTLEKAQQEINEELNKHCPRGKRTRALGWASSETMCTYDVLLINN